MEFFFSSQDVFFHSLDILAGFSLGQTDGIAAAGDGNADIFFPVGSFQTVDPDNSFTTMIIDFFQSMEQGITGSILLVFGYGVF